MLQLWVVNEVAMMDVGLADGKRVQRRQEVGTVALGRRLRIGCGSDLGYGARTRRSRRGGRGPRSKRKKEVSIVFFKREEGGGGGKTYGEANLCFLYAGVGRGVAPEVGAAREGGASFALGLGLRLEAPPADFLQGGALSDMTINGDQSRGRGVTVVVEKKQEENAQPQSCHQGTIQLDDKNCNRIFLPKKGSQFNLPTTRRDQSKVKRV
ncbi:hypothetical protein C8J57DRAFT_1233823 [Mycena rebaudengoi]|nr:hypothetical protein C8J57DRAFT_1233823 [Mycena rebaudengoi]